MEFTGERFIPDLTTDSEMAIEHLQRYHSIKDIVKDKVVLDAACGEGYGASILVQSAKTVYAIDISEEAIAHANVKYKNKKLNFINGSIEHLLLEEDSVDVVVSFETIEHVDEKIQIAFLKEIKRVLKKDGILIMSTPNKYVYSDLANYKNQYHINEFYKEEFHDLLNQYFQYIHFYSQSFQVASFIKSDEKKNKRNINVIEVQEHRPIQGKYIIAICSDTAFASDITTESIVLDYQNTYQKLVDRTVDLQNEVHIKNLHIQKQNDFIDERDSLIQTQNNRIEDLSVWAQTLDTDIKNKEKLIADCQNTNQELVNRIIQLQQEVDVKNLHIQKQNDFIHERDCLIQIQNDRIEELLEWGQRLDTNIKNKESLIVESTNKIKKLYEQNESKDQMIQKQNKHIEQLLEKEKLLNQIYQSKGWKALIKYYHIRDGIFPQNSKRKLFVHLFVKIIKNPKRIFHYFKPLNIQKFIKHMKHEDANELEERVNKYMGQYEPIKAQAFQVFEQQHTYEKVIFNETKTPLVSIIIPVYNQWEYTYSCLQSIFENTQGISYEIIIADDQSNDETVNVNRYVENIKVIRNEKNLGFLLNCNNAARETKGKYIVFLNNDTNVQKDWLKYLVDLIESDETIGMVGSKLVYEDGRLQEAGGIIWKDATGWNYGRLDDPEKPEYNYVKEVDYISAASIMIRTDLWEKIGGFDERYTPAYFEDSDLAFEVRKHGYKVVYQPKSVVIHFEGISHGTDTYVGVKKYQIDNRDKFYNKWKEELISKHFNNEENIFWARDRSGNKKTILVIDHYVPHYDQDAGSRTSFQYLKLFLNMGLNVKFMADNFYPHEPYTSALQALGIEVLYGLWYSTSYKKWIKENADKIDYVYLNRPHISIKYIDFIKENTKAKIIYYGHDLHYLREQREYEITKDAKLLESSERWRRTEFQLVNKSDVIYYPSQIEIDEIKTYYPNVNAKAVPAYIFENKELKKTIPFEKRKDLLFVGGFTHKPNVDAVIWFVTEVFPTVLEVIPDIKFYIVGSNTPDEIKSLQNDNIRVTGFISDDTLRQYYEECKIAVVPLRYGAGVKGKIVEAMYYGIPVITTSIGAEGLYSAEKCLVICDEKKEFAQQIISLYHDSYKIKSTDLIKNSQLYVTCNFSEKKVYETIKFDIKEI